MSTSTVKATGVKKTALPSQPVKETHPYSWKFCSIRQLLNFT